MGAQWWRFGCKICSFIKGAMVSYSSRRFSRPEAVSRHAAVGMRWTLHTVARKKQDTRTQRDRRVCVAGAWVCACRLRVREGRMRWRVLGHGGQYVRVRCGEKVACNLLRAC